MPTSWHELLRPLCVEACDVAGSDVPVEIVLFYVARWCQKETGAAEPDIAAFEEGDLVDIAAHVVYNLDRDGARVDRLVDGDAGEWTELRRLLCASARRRAGEKADEFADEAMQKIAEVLLTGTAPSKAAAQLARAIEGPRNEYVFSSPFTPWARRVVINLIKDGRRREEHEREASSARAARTSDCLDSATVQRAWEALPSLLDAIGELPPRQRSVMVWTLVRDDLAPVLVEHLRELAPDLFAETGGGTVSSDSDIAKRLGTTARLVAANRSVARCKLAARDPYWKLLLDGLMPHRSTRSTQEEDHHG